MVLKRKKNHFIYKERQDTNQRQRGGQGRREAGRERRERQRGRMSSPGMFLERLNSYWIVRWVHWYKYKLPLTSWRSTGYIVPSKMITEEHWLKVTVQPKSFKCMTRVALLLSNFYSKQITTSIKAFGQWQFLKWLPEY